MKSDLELRPLKRGACRHLVSPAHAEFLTHAGAAAPYKWSEEDRYSVKNTKFSLEAVRAFEGTRLWRQQIEAEIIDIEN
jgi:hypothetical protein